ncbi:class I SAM-dependent methyltransferase [Paenibacillus lutrae]|nr:class I SAM-dependent methyltransferase [Paenibacillus lutrae]
MNEEWFRRSFGKDYLLVYKHRNFEGAYAEVKKMIDWLDLPKGAEVLDLCCGMGRHSLALADLGYNVTGVDLSEVLLEEARKQDQEGRVAWMQGDMRCVPVDRTFDAVVNLFTSFGYFENDQENGRVPGEIARLLKPGGRFIIDFLNPDFVKQNLVPHSLREEEGQRIEETRYIEDGYVRKKISIQDEEHGERDYSEQVRLYERDAFLKMLEEAGLRVDHVYGGYDGSAYEPETSARMIFVGSRTGSVPQ